jgi:hypothetical protein
MKNNLGGFMAAAMLLGVPLLAGCGPAHKSFEHDVRPILQQNCIECHQPGGLGFLASGLDMSSYDSLMKGTKFGPVIKPGDSVSSVLNMLVEGRANPAIRMPHGREALKDKDIETLKLWVDQGAKND